MAYGDDNAGIWLVVKPTIGLPIYLIAVAITALVVHWAILSHTTWFGSYWQGSWRNKPAVTGSVDPAPQQTAIKAAALD